MLSFTVGSGGDYATWKAAETGLAGGLADDTELEQISDVTETSQAAWDMAKNGFTLTLKSSVDHLGVWANAYKTNINLSGLVWQIFDSGTPVLTIEGLAFYFQHASASGILAQVTSARMNVTVRKCLFDLNTRDAIAVNLLAFGNGFGTSVGEIYNCKAWNKTGLSSSSRVFSGYGSNYVAENNSVYIPNSRGGVGADNEGKAFNNMVIAASVCFVYDLGVSGTATARNNASSDTTSDDADTQSDNLTGRTTADFLSVDPANSNFLVPSVAAIQNGGRTPTIAGNTTGIEGFARPNANQSVSIGAHQALYASSLSVAGAGFNVRQWPRPLVKPSIQWVQDTAGNWNGSDRGASQDIYEVEVVFYDRESAINTLQDTLDDNREGITLSGFTAPIFAPNVDHTGSISASVVKVGPRRHMGFGVPSSTSQLFEMPVTFRAISPTLLGTSPSLSTLKLQEGYTPENSYTAVRNFSLNQTAFYADHRADIGVFKGRFRQKTSQVQAILAYLLVTARASAISFPSIGVTYPFGINRGALPKNCKVKSWSLERVNFVFWDLEIEMVEDV